MHNNQAGFNVRKQQEDGDRISSADWKYEVQMQISAVNRSWLS